MKKLQPFSRHNKDFLTCIYSPIYDTYTLFSSLIKFDNVSKYNDETLLKWIIFNIMCSFQLKKHESHSYAKIQKSGETDGFCI